MINFPDELQETIVVQFNNTILRIEVANGEIAVDDVMGTGDSMDPLELCDTDLYYWLGAVYWWYRFDGGDYWSTSDWYRAAQCCLILKHVPTVSYLRRVCGIQATGEPYSYHEMVRQMDLVDFCNKCNCEFREGAD